MPYRDELRGLSKASGLNLGKLAISEICALIISTKVSIVNIGGD